MYECLTNKTNWLKENWVALLGLVGVILMVAGAVIIIVNLALGNLLDPGGIFVVFVGAMFFCFGGIIADD